MRRIVGGQIARAIGQKSARLATDQKDLICKLAVIGRDNRDTELFKADGNDAYPALESQSAVVSRCWRREDYSQQHHAKQGAYYRRQTSDIHIAFPLTTGSPDRESAKVIPLATLIFELEIDVLMKSQF